MDVYHELFKTPLSDQDIYDICLALNTNRIIGAAKFQQKTEKVLGLKTGFWEVG